MKTSDIFPELENRIPRSRMRNAQIIRGIQIFSWALTLLFLISLIWAVYQAIFSRDPLPSWAWLGLVVLFAVATGLVVAVAVYRGVSKQVGPFDYRTFPRAGEIRSEAKRFETQGARSLRAELNMIQGLLQIMPAAPEAPGTKFRDKAVMDAAVREDAVMDAADMEVAFTYDDADWEPPLVEYTVDGEGLGNLRVAQKATGRPAMRPGRCEWALHLAGDLPTELSIKIGAGNADLKLGDLALDRLRVESGVGELTLDLSGSPKRDLEAFVKTGIGDTTLRLPKNAGVRLFSTVGWGSIAPHGLTKEGDTYTNASYGESPVTLDITLEGGIGKIHIEEE
jgi:hypothetical protein